MNPWPGIMLGGGGTMFGGGGTGVTVGSGVGGASANSWWGRSAWDSGFWAASSLSAAEPCLSPLESFLKAYEMEMALLHRYCPGKDHTVNKHSLTNYVSHLPFIASMAASEASKLA